MIDIIESVWEAIQACFGMVMLLFETCWQVFMYLIDEISKILELLSASLGWSIELIYLIFPASWAIIIATGLLIAVFYKAVGRN